MIHGLAADLLPEAKAAVAANPTALRRHLLKVAEELFRKGSDQVTDAQASTRGRGAAVEVGGYLEFPDRVTRLDGDGGGPDGGCVRAGSLLLRGMPWALTTVPRYP